MSPQDEMLEAELYDSEDSVSDEVTYVTGDGYDYRMFMMSFTDLFRTEVLHAPSKQAYMASPSQCTFALN